MSILVTGGSGFVGLNILEQLLTRGDDVVCLGANDVPPIARADFARLSGRLVSVVGDVSQPGAIERAIREHGCKRVVHAAAITAGGARDEREPARVVEVNLLGTIYALQAARDCGIERFVYPSTGGHYGAAGIGLDHYLDEEADRPVPNSMYGITKYASERTVMRLGQVWKLDYRIGRVAMVYGRWEYETGLRDSMTTLLQSTRIAMRGGEAVMTRLGAGDWMYSVDLANALIALLDAPAPRQRLYHLGVEAPFATPDWCARLQRHFPGFRYRESDDPAECNVAPLTPFRVPFATRRLREDIAFKPQFANIDAAFDDYVRWLQTHRDFVVRSKD